MLKRKQRGNKDLGRFYIRKCLFVCLYDWLESEVLTKRESLAITDNQGEVILLQHVI